MPVQASKRDKWQFCQVWHPAIIGEHSVERTVSWDGPLHPHMTPATLPASMKHSLLCQAYYDDSFVYAHVNVILNSAYGSRNDSVVNNDAKLEGMKQFPLNL
jgi:hypothetical protein